MVGSLGSSWRFEPLRTSLGISGAQITGASPQASPHSPKRCTRLFRHTVISMLPAFVEERYMEDPGAWGDEWPENPPIHEAADM